MPGSTQTRAVSPIALARHSARGRLIRRALAVGALALFVAGMLVAAGLGAAVATAVPVIAAAVVAAAAVWFVWRNRPWRAARFAARAVAHAAAAGGRVVAKLGRTAGSSTAGAIAAVPAAARAAAPWLKEFVERPREPWQPPPVALAALDSSRSSLGALLARATPARQAAHRSVQELAAGTSSATARWLLAARAKCSGTGRS